MLNSKENGMSEEELLKEKKLNEEKLKEKICKVKESLEAEWEFHHPRRGRSEERKELSSVEYELVRDENIDFPSIISDFYHIDAINRIILENKKEDEEAISIKIDNLQIISEEYKKILNLKLSYIKELLNCIEFLKLSLDNKGIDLQYYLLKEYYPRRKEYSKN